MNCYENSFCAKASLLACFIHIATKFSSSRQNEGCIVDGDTA